MKEHHRGFVRGIVIGLTVGLLLGGTGAAWATFAKKGWERFGQWFQEGYVAGFNDCVRLAKALDPQGYVATNYVVPPKAKPHMWRLKINELYAKKEHAERPMSQIMVIAGKDLAKATGYVEIQGGDPRMENLRKALDTRRKAIRDTAKAADLPASPEAKTGEPAAGSGDAPSSPVAVETKPQTPQAPKEASPSSPTAPQSDAPH